jgi:hypothetical protein
MIVPKNQSDSITEKIHAANPRFPFHGLKNVVHKPPVAALFNMEGGRAARG